MNPETKILNEIRLSCGRAILFRNQVGACTTPDGYFIRYGVGGPGGSDLIGFTPRNGVAVFTAIEVKAATGRVSPEQQNFIDVIRRSGGIAGIARSVEDAQKLIRGF